MSEVSGCAHAVPAGTIGAIGKTAHAHRPQPAAEAVHRNSAARMVDLSHALVEQYTHAHHDPGQHADHHRGIGRHEGARSGNRHQAGQHPVAGHGDIRLAEHEIPKQQGRRRAVLISLLVCLIPTTIGGLLSALGIAGMDRVVQHNVLAMSGKAVEAAGDVNTLLLDKTGTITLGNRQAVEFIPIGDASEGELADAAQLSSLADETPEGRSIVVLAKEKYAYRGREVAEHEAHFIPFTAQTRMSGVDIDGRRIRKGATESVVEFVQEQGGPIPPELTETTQRISRSGGTPLVVADRDHVLGAIHLKDVVKGGMRERFEQLRRIGIRTVMFTGDNPLTAAAIAAEAGVDDFLAQATPKDKMDLIKKEQAGGRLVAMTGDGTNDAPALAQADVGLAMNTGTMAAKEAGNMVDLDSNPTKLIEVVAIGKQLLMTRGSLTTFSIANDVAKYFAILPAMFMATYPSLSKLNIMFLRNPQSAVLAAVIFNALIIISLIPLALRGVAYKPLSAAKLLRRNLLIYGVGGVIAPFPGIWVIDRILGLLHLA